MTDSQQGKCSTCKGRGMIVLHQLDLFGEEQFIGMERCKTCGGVPAPMQQLVLGGDFQEGEAAE